MSEWITPKALADGWAPGLQLDDNGTPTIPLLFVDLSHPPEDSRAASAVAGSASALLVGVADAVTPALQPLMEALTFTLTPDERVGRLGVVVSDLADAVERVKASVEGCPNAAVTLGHLLRLTSRTGVQDGLVAESAIYSMLLGSKEFHRWLDRRRRTTQLGSASAPRVTVERVRDQLMIMLTRPEKRNAFDAAMRDELVEALTLAIADPSLTVKLAGVGPDFSSGGDLDEFGATGDPVTAYQIRVERHPGWLLHRLGPRATVEVHGACIGAGIEIPAFAGQVAAARTAYFELPEVRMGLIPGAGGTVSITRRIGRWRTAWLALTGLRLDAVTALEWGLVDKIREF